MHSRLPRHMDEEDAERLSLKARAENYEPLKPAERLRCGACNYFHFRLWYDRCQCLSCKGFTRFEVGEPDRAGQLDIFEGETAAGVRKLPADLRRVPWVRKLLSLLDEERVICPTCRHSEYAITGSSVRCRWCRQEICLQPPITGFWLLEKKAVAKRDSKVIRTSKEALALVKRLVPSKVARGFL